jgi:hypothetical protein
VNNLRCGAVYQDAAVSPRPVAGREVPVTPLTPPPGLVAYKWFMRHATITALAAAALVLAVPARAQETGTPVFSAPYRAFADHEAGLSLSAPGGADLGLEGFYSFASGRNDFGLRVGLIDAGDDSSLALGARFRTRVVTHSPDFPLDGALTIGVGAVFQDGATVVRVPIGLSLGRRIDSRSSGLSFVPYLQPTLVPTFGRGDSELGFALGLGLDLRLTRRFDLRLSGSVGDLEGFAVSFAWVR